MQYFTPHCVPVTWQSLALTGVGDNVPYPFSGFLSKTSGRTPHVSMGSAA